MLTFKELLKYPGAMSKNERASIVESNEIIDQEKEMKLKFISIEDYDEEKLDVIIRATNFAYTIASKISICVYRFEQFH